MAHNERVDSYSSLPVAEVRGSLLTGCPVPAKTESVSESVDKITGDYLRLQLFYGVHKYEDCPTQTADRRAAEPRAHIRGGEGGVTRSGANASLDDIAKEAGIGAGTLYRHFPTREALIEAVYRTEVQKLAGAE